MNNKERISESPLRNALRRFSHNKLALAGLWVIIGLYLCAAFADFISPYSYTNENRDYSYCPPMPVQIFNANGKLTRPFVYGMALTYNEYHGRVYTIDKTKFYPIRFFVRGDRYKLLGFVPCSYHLFGINPNARMYLWGADSRGRDMMSRILWGSRVSLSISLAGVLISLVIGLLVGGIAGYYGGALDNILMRLCEMIMMVPGFYLMLALRAAFPPNLSSLQVFLLIVFIFSFIGWAGMARVIRGMSVSLREREYVVAAKAMGLSDMYIIVRHILPQTFSYAIVALVLAVPGYILGESGLSFIGLGIQDPYASWGNLLSDAMGIVQMRFYPWIMLPGLFIMITVMAFNMVGDALRDVLDPLMKEGNKS